MSRIKDFESRHHIQAIITSLAQEIGPVNRRGETRMHCLVEGAAAGNLIQPKGRLKGQAAWQDIGSALSGLIAGASTAVDVKNFDEIKFVVTGRVAAGATAQAQTLTPDAAPDAGTYKLSYNGTQTAAIAFGATNAQIQAALRLIPALGQCTVTGTLATAVVVTLPGIISPSLLVFVDIDLTAAAVPVVVTAAVTTPEVVGSEVKFLASGFWD